MRKFFAPANVIWLILFSFIANSFLLIENYTLSLIGIILIFLLINIFVGTVKLKTSYTRLKICYHGGVLLCIFIFSCIASTIYHLAFAIFLNPEAFMSFIWSIVFCVCAEALIFWNGIICVYCTSVQLGIKTRVIGLICGMIPILNLIVLVHIIKLVMAEIEFEVAKEKLNANRKSQELCKTKYPILLVHGVFFRDSNLFNYWGRIPKELEMNGAEVYYGEHQSALSVKMSAKELAIRIKRLVEDTGCKKVNIIAHSKGGLDCRYALSELEIAPYVASLTTINTPHRGCLFAEKLLYKFSDKFKNFVANIYNSTLKKLGDKNPDFIAAVSDITVDACNKLNEELKTPQGIFYQSVGSKLNKATGGKFPLNFSYGIVKRYDGANDGLVGVDSFAWGDKYTLIEVSGKRGVSHGDMIDLNRENINDFDVREFYVKLINDLKNRGF